MAVVIQARRKIYRDPVYGWLVLCPAGICLYGKKAYPGGSRLITGGCLKWQYVDTYVVHLFYHWDLSCSPRRKVPCRAGSEECLLSFGDFIPVHDIDTSNKQPYGSVR